MMNIQHSMTPKNIEKSRRSDFIRGMEGGHCDKFPHPTHHGWGMEGAPEVASPVVERI